MANNADPPEPRPGDPSGTTVASYMTRTVITAPETASVAEVCAKMTHHRISCIVILQGSEPVGVFTERDATRWIAEARPTHTPVNKALRRRLIAVVPNETVDAALVRMRKSHVRRLAVVHDGQLVGIVTQTNLLEASRRLLMQMTEHQEELFRQALSDPLTGLVNRRAFLRVLSTEIQRLHRYGGMLAVVMFDLDRFKTVNDDYGHPTGDLVLKGFADILRDNCREVDIPARYGGEEFLVLLPAADSAGGRVFADRVRERTAAHSLVVGDTTLTVTVSAGVAMATTEDASQESLLALVDHALYEAKRKGRNRVEVAN